MTMATQLTPARRGFGTVSIAVAVGLLAGTANQASAASRADEPAAAVVRFGDLKLDTDAGSLMLYRRLRALAALVYPQWDAHDLGSFVANRERGDAALERAATEIGSQRLVAILTG